MLPAACTAEEAGGGMELQEDFLCSWRAVRPRCGGHVPPHTVMLPLYCPGRNAPGAAGWEHLRAGNRVMGTSLPICHLGGCLIHFPPKLGNFLDYFLNH